MHANNVCHFAVHANDVERAKKFYQRVFDWRFQEWGPPEFYLINTGNDKSPGILGALQKRTEPLGEGYNGYECSITVANIDETAQSIVDNGGSIIDKQIEIPTVGVLVKFADTEGNTACAIQYFETSQKHNQVLEALQMLTSDPPTEWVLSELMGNRDTKVTETALAARKAVLKIATGCSELIYQSYCISDAFSFTGKLGQSFIHIATYTGHVNLGFSRGVELDDPTGLLEGTGKLIRHVRLHGKSDLRKAPIKNLIKSAVDQGRTMAANKGGIAPAIVVVNR